MRARESSRRRGIPVSRGRRAGARGSRGSKGENGMRARPVERRSRPEATGGDGSPPEVSWRRVAIPEARKRGRWAVKLALVPLVLLGTLLIAEGAARVRARRQGEPYTAAATEREMRRLVGGMTASRLQGMTEDVDERNERLERAAALRARKPEGWKMPDLGLVTLHPYLGFDWDENTARIGSEVEY